jgi:hypothetical protein
MAKYVELRRHTVADGDVLTRRVCGPPSRSDRTLWGLRPAHFDRRAAGDSDTRLLPRRPRREGAERSRGRAGTALPFREPLPSGLREGRQRRARRGPRGRHRACGGRLGRAPSRSRRAARGRSRARRRPTARRTRRLSSASRARSSTRSRRATGCWSSNRTDLSESRSSSREQAPTAALSQAERLQERLQDTECRTVEQMKLVNELCRFVEIAEGEE